MFTSPPPPGLGLPQQQYAYTQQYTPYTNQLYSQQYTQYADEYLKYQQPQQQQQQRFPCMHGGCGAVLLSLPEYLVHLGTHSDQVQPQQQQHVGLGYGSYLGQPYQQQQQQQSSFGTGGSLHSLVESLGWGGPNWTTPGQTQPQVQQQVQPPGLSLGSVFDRPPGLADVLTRPATQQQQQQQQQPLGLQPTWASDSPFAQLASVFQQPAAVADPVLPFALQQPPQQQQQQQQPDKSAPLVWKSVLTSNLPADHGQPQQQQAPVVVMAAEAERAMQRAAREREPQPIPPSKMVQGKLRGMVEAALHAGGVDGAIKDGKDPLTLEILQVCESLLLDPAELEVKRAVLAELQALVSGAFEGSRLTLYGSSANMLANKASDADICLEVDEEKFGDKASVVTKLGALLGEEGSGFGEVQALESARVPVVKFMHLKSGLHCDICVNNTLALHNTKLIRDYITLDPRVRKLAYVIKHWAAQRAINKPFEGFFSSYGLVLMLISSMQIVTPPVLPCLQAIPPGLGRQEALEFSYRLAYGDIPEECRPRVPVRDVQGWNVYSYPHAEHLAGFGANNKMNLGELLGHFFHTWGTVFDPEKEVASVRIGRLITKEDKDWTVSETRNRHLMCVEDPFDLNHDLGRNVDRRTFKTLRNEFERSARLIQEGQPLNKVAQPYKFQKK